MLVSNSLISNVDNFRKVNYSNCPKIHMACDALGFILTGANAPDFDQAKPLLLKHLGPDALALMDRNITATPSAFI